jgi:hypothetical protein
VADAPGPPGALASLLATAGLEAVTDGEVAVQARFSSFDDYWEPFELPLRAWFARGTVPGFGRDGGT